MVCRHLTWFCGTVLCNFRSHLQQLRNKYALTHSVTSADECDLNWPSYLRRHIICFQFDTRNSIYCTQNSLSAHYSSTYKNLHKKRNKSYGATQPASMGDLEAGNLLNTFHFFTSTHKNCVYWDEPTVAKSVMWLRYAISNRGTAVPFPAQVPTVSWTTQLPTQRLPAAVSPGVRRWGVQLTTGVHLSGGFRSEWSCTSTPSKGFKTLTGTVLCVLRVRSSWPKSLKCFNNRRNLRHL